MNNNQINFDPVTGQPIQNGSNYQIQQQENQQYQQMPNYNISPQKKKNPIKIILMIIGGIAVFFIGLWCIIFFGTSALSNKLVCKSNEGNITIMYTDNQITGYKANGVSYNFDAQKQIAERIGVEDYISQFESMFTMKTTGNCERK